MKTLFFTVMAVMAFTLSACTADTHLRHDDTSRSSGDTPGNPY